MHTHTHTEWGPWAIFNANMHNTLVTTGRQVVFIFFDTTMKLGSIQLNINFSEVTQVLQNPHLMIVGPIGCRPYCGFSSPPPCKPIINKEP